MPGPSRMFGRQGAGPPNIKGVGPSGLIDLLGARPTGPQLAQFDPGLGRGYRIGAAREVALGTTGGATLQGFLLANHAHIEEVVAYKLVLQASVPQGAVKPPRNGAFLRFYVRSSVENDRILRIADVSVGSDVVLYPIGRSINIQVDNTMGIALVAEMAMDEHGPGISTWMAHETFTALAVETDLNIVPFTTTFHVYTPLGGAAPRLRGYAPGGVLVIDQVLTTPYSGDIDRMPGIDYTLDTSGAASNYAVNYLCFG